MLCWFVQVNIRTLRLPRVHVWCILSKRQVGAVFICLCINIYYILPGDHVMSNGNVQTEWLTCIKLIISSLIITTVAVLSDICGWRIYAWYIQVICVKMRYNENTLKSNISFFMYCYLLFLCSSSQSLFHGVIYVLWTFHIYSYVQQKHYKGPYFIASIHVLYAPIKHVTSNCVLSSQLDVATTCVTLNFGVTYWQ